MKTGRNDPCPCGSMQKYKNCCIVKGIDYSTISPSGFIRNLTIRGKNKWFLNSVFDILDFNSNIQDIKDWQSFVALVKKTLTPGNVRRVYELIPFIWPDKEDYYRCLNSSVISSSGVFIGEYRIESTAKLVNKYGLYEDVIVLIDPIVDHRCLKEEYNPVDHPERHIISTLHSLLLWIQMLPWIDAGVVQIIRDPGDYNYKLRIDTYDISKRRYEESGLIKLIQAETTEDKFSTRAKSFLLLSMPDEEILRYCRIHYLDSVSMMEQIKQERFRCIEYLVGGSESQFLTTFSGTSYEMAKHICSISKSHLLTDLKIKWLEMEYDRKAKGLQNNDWEVFSKHFQQVNLPFLNGLRPIDVLKLRDDGHLSRMRDFLKKLWLRSSPGSATEQHVIEQLGLELIDEVRQAESEWKNIDRNLAKWFLPNIPTLGIQLLTGTPWWISGATAAMTGAAAVIESHNKHKSFLLNHPAGFFLERN